MLGAWPTIVLALDENKMTTPTERAAAVLRTRGFLEKLAFANEKAVPRELSLEAETLLRHFPTKYEIELTGAAFPTCWQTNTR